MTVTTEGSRLSYAGTGVTTGFAVTRKFMDPTHLRVYLVDNATLVATLQVLNTHYSVTGALDPLGGTVTFGSAPAAGKTVLIIRQTPDLQSMNLQNSGGALDMESLEQAYDRLVVEVQELRGRMARMLELPETALDTASLLLPSPLVANYVLAVNAGATGLEWRVNAGGGGGGGAAGQAHYVLRQPVGGTAQAITGTTGFSISSISDYDIVSWYPALDNTGANPTLAVDSVTAKTIKAPGGGNLAAGDQFAGRWYDGLVRGANIELMSF